MRLICVFLFVLFSTTNSAQNPTLVWSGKIGSSQDDAGYSIISKNASLLITGTFRGTIDLDPGNGTFVQNMTGVQSAYIAQLDVNGDLEWGKILGGTGWITPTKTLLDANGDIIIAGMFNDQIDFDPSSGTFSMTSIANQDGFIVKLDGNGNFLWAGQFSPTNYFNMSDASVDNNGNITIAGWFMGTCDFNPGVGTNSLTAANNMNGFVVKIDAGGNYVWADQFVSTSSTSCESVTMNASGDVFVFGSASGLVDLDPGAGLDTLSGSDLDFLCKLNSSGQLQWREVWDDTGFFMSSGMTCDQNGNILVTGGAMGTVDLDPGPATLQVPTDSSDVFILKLDPSGSFIFGRVFGGSGMDFGIHIETDASNKILLAGFFVGGVDMDPGLGTYYLNSAGGDDGFVSQFNSSGILLSSFQVGGTQDDMAGCATNTNDSTVVITGVFRSTSDFQPGPLMIGENATGMRDAFVCSYNLLTGIESHSNRSEFSVAPNPAHGTLTLLGLKEQTTAILYDALGKIVLEIVVSPSNNQIDINEVAAGMYTMQLQGASSTSNQRVIIAR